MPDSSTYLQSWNEWLRSNTVPKNPADLLVSQLANVMKECWYDLSWDQMVNITEESLRQKYAAAIIKEFKCERVTSVQTPPAES